MKLHLPLPLRKCLLLFYVASTIPAWGGGMHEDFAKRTYSDFGQNKGRFRVTGVSSMLQAIRDRDGGIAITKADGEVTWVIPEEQGMINFANTLDYGANGTQCHGAAAAFGANYLVTVAHNPGFSASFGTTQLGSEHTIKYSTVNITERDWISAADWALYRQNKIFTDVVGAYNYSGVSSETQDSDGNGILDLKEQLEGERLYRAFAGNVRVWKEDGSLVDAGSPYTTILGGISYIGSLSVTSGGIIFGSWSMQNESSWVSELAPLPTNGQGGDSGSPVYVYNEEAGRYEYILSQRAVNFTTGTYAHGAIDYANEIQEMHRVQVDMSNTDTAYLNQVTGGCGVIQLGEQQISHLAVNSGSHTWKNLDSVKNNENWYAYDNNFQNSFDGLGSTHNLIFTGSDSSKSHDIILNATVDTGVGYLEFNQGKFIIKNAENGDYTLNSAGYVINEGAEVHVQLTNPADYMREWRKNGGGDLYIEGSGDNNILLAVGGSGSTYLNRENGYAAYNVLASSGATVVIQDIGQIERDFTFGLNGGTLDMNGNSMDWRTSNTDIDAAGFSINALTDDAVIMNSSGNSELVYRESGQTVWKGSLKDTTAGSLSIVADMGAGSVWTLNSVCTDLSNNAASSFTVQSGTVVLGGINTEHGTGSVSYSDEIFFSEDDWHYADAKMNVTVNSGTQFTLDTHARLLGDITVNSGATYEMHEGVHHRMEYIEGGVIKEDTSEWSAYYGHHGDTNLAGGSLKVTFADKTTATHTYGGNITGTGIVTVDAANSMLVLSGNNSFTGSGSVIGGTLMVEDAAAAGNQKWVVGEKGIFSAKDADGDQILSYIDESSKGVLALGKDQTTQIDTSGHADLIIGVLAGQTVQYGELNTTEKLAANNKVWRLGGGGGNLVVNYHLTGDNMLILGNDYTKGTVTLTNTLNDFTGGIDFAGGGVTLEYTSEAAIKDVTLNLSYGNRVAMANLLSNVKAESDGILLQNQTTQDIDLSKHQSLALGAKENLNYSGIITVAENQAYRLSAADGTFTVNSEIGGNHDLIVDAQGYTGGIVQLTNLNNLTGNVTVMGSDGSHSQTTGGDITLRITQNDILKDAECVTLKSGGTLDIGSTTQHFGKLQLEEGSAIIGNYRNDNNGTAGSEIHLTIDSLSDIKGTVQVETIHKYGDNVLELDNSYNHSSNLQYSYLYVEEGDVKLTQKYSTVGFLYIRDNTLYLNGNNLSLGAVLAEDGARIDATVAGSGIGGTSYLHALSGTVVMDNGGNDVTLAGNVGAQDGATLKLVGSGKWILSASGYNTSTGTLRIEDASQLDFTYGTKSDYTYFSAFDIVSGTLDLDTGIQTLQAASDTVTQHMGFDTIKLNGQNLTLKEKSKSATWIIGKLDSGEFSDSVLTWEATQSNSATWADRNTSEWTQYITVTNSSRLILNGDNPYTGSVVAKRTANGSGFSTFVELAHDNALKNATLDMQSISGSTMALAVNTENAKLKGLMGDENSYAYSGASSDIKLDSAREGDGRNTLTITGDGTYEYKGAVNGLNLTMAGSGTQKFSGSDIKVQNITALAGRLEFTNAPTVADTVYLAQGATLKLSDSYSLNEGVTLALIAGDSGTQGTLEGTLVLNGGTLQFDGSVLNAGSSLLSANTSFGTDFTTQTISFSNCDDLELGSTYTLLSGNWSGRSAALAANMPDYLQGSIFTADSSGLKMEIKLAGGFNEWQDDKSIFAAGNTVLFRDTAPATSLNFSQACSAGGLRFVNDETYTFSGSDVTLSGDVSMDRGKLVVRNKLTAADYLSEGGELELGADGVLELTETQDSAATVNNLSGTGTLRLKLNTSGNTYSNTLAVDADFEGTTHVTAGNLTLTGSTFGNTLQLASGSNAQITAGTTIDGNIRLDGSSEVHQNIGNTLTIDGKVSGDSGIWVRKGGGTLNLNGSVNLAGFDTGSDNTTSNFNGSTAITTVTLDQSNITANFNGNATVGTLNPNGSNVTLGGTGKLSVGNFALNAGKEVSIDGLSITETSAQTRSWNNNTLNLKNGAVLDTRESYINHQSGKLTIGGDAASGTMYVKGLCLMPNDAQAKSEFTLSKGAHLIISGEKSGTTASDFVLAVGGEKSELTAGANIININGTLTSNAAMTLYYKSANISVQNDGRLNLLDGLVLKGTAYNDWMGTMKANLLVQEGGQLYAAGGTQRSELVVNMASDSTLGAIGSADSTVRFTNNMTLGTAGKEGTFTVDTAATTADDNYLLTRSADKGVTVDMTGSLNVQGTTTIEVIGSGTLNHKADFNAAAAIKVHEGAHLSVESDAALTTAAELNKSTLTLRSASVSTSGISVTDAATVRATEGTSTMSASTTLTNEAVVTYDISGGAELKSTGTLTAASSRGSLIKQGDGTLQLNNEANALANIRVDAGELSIHGAAAYDLNELEAAASADLSFYAGAVGNSATEAEVRVGGAAVFGTGAKLNANLTLTGGSALEVAEGGLAMGSTLTLEEGITLGASTLERVRALTVGESATLFTGVDGLTLGGTEYSTITKEDSILASPYFSNLTNNYVLTYTGTDNGSLNITMVTAAVPEPTTATLSLLALAALAARRRRK